MTRAFMAGYPKSVVFPASSTLPELVVFLFGGTHPEVAYKVSRAGVCRRPHPWLVAAAGVDLLAIRGRGNNDPPSACSWRTSGPTFRMNYAGFGMLPYLLAIPLGLLAAGVLAHS